MKGSTTRWLLYGSAFAVTAGVLSVWRCEDVEADVTVLLGSAKVQLQAAYMTPAVDRDGAELSARAELVAAAVAHLNSVERRCPGMAATAELRGFAHMVCGEHRAAAARYAAARGCEDCGEEQRDVVTFNEARMLVAASEPELALQVLARYRVALDARYGHARRLTEAAILMDLGRREEAVTRWQAVTADATASPMARLEAATGYLDMGLDEAAATALESVGEALPIADYCRARLKLRRGDVDSSFALLRRAHAARPTEVRRRLREDVDAWSTVSDDERLLRLQATPPASPGR